MWNWWARSISSPSIILYETEGEMSETSVKSTLSVPKCMHGKAKLYTSSSRKNPGRMFFRCPEWKVCIQYKMSYLKHCKYTYWLLKFLQSNKSCLFQWLEIEADSNGINDNSMAERMMLYEMLQHKDTQISYKESMLIKKEEEVKVLKNEILRLKKERFVLKSLVCISLVCVMLCFLNV